jgi:hypothetical protein
MQMAYKNVDDVIVWIRNAKQNPKAPKTIYVLDSVRAELYVSEHQFGNKLFHQCTFEDLKGGVWAIHFKG